MMGSVVLMLTENEVLQRHQLVFGLLHLKLKDIWALKLVVEGLVLSYPGVRRQEVQQQVPSGRGHG
jgi:hypothetical protein